MSPEPGTKEDRQDGRGRLGLVLGSGAARGWAHVGVLRALDELGIKIDVYTGCSAGAIVSAARLLGIFDEALAWAKTIGPIDALSAFSLQVRRGGLVNPDKAFSAFSSADQEISALKVPWGAAATDLATGEAVYLTTGSVLDACRASSAVPMILQARRWREDLGERWLIDGAVSDPVPVSLARQLGATHVLAVDLVSASLGIERFHRPATRAVVPVDSSGVDDLSKDQTAFEAFDQFLKQQGQEFSRRRALAKARAKATPQLFETAVATMDIVQAQLARARAVAEPADLTFMPDLRFASAASFDEWERFEAAGYAATMAQRDAIIALANAASGGISGCKDPLQDTPRP